MIVRGTQNVDRCAKCGPRACGVNAWV